jgi:hypothetical protein
MVDRMMQNEVQIHHRGQLEHTAEVHDLEQLLVRQFRTVSRCDAKLSVYQAARSAEFLMDSGRGIGVKSKAPAATALRNRISVAAMCHARSSAVFEIRRDDNRPCRAESLRSRLLGEAMFIFEVREKNLV